MHFPDLAEYLRRLPRQAHEHHRIWLDTQGRAQGRYFNCMLTSEFQPVRQFGDFSVVGYEALVRSASETEGARSIWKLLEGAASDDESIALDRLCRMVHAINFFRQSPEENVDLYLNVHERLLAAVASSHGLVYRRILASLGLPVERIVLQLPAIRPGQQFLLNYVVDNYRRSGFRVALNALDAADGLRLQAQVAPDVIKLDAAHIADAGSLEALTAQCSMRGTVLLLKHADALPFHPAPDCRRTVLAQGRSWDTPAAALDHSDEQAISAVRGGVVPNRTLQSDKSSRICRSP